MAPGAPTPRGPEEDVIAVASSSSNDASPRLSSATSRGGSDTASPLDHAPSASLRTRQGEYWYDPQDTGCYPPRSYDMPALNDLEGADELERMELGSAGEVSVDPLEYVPSDFGKQHKVR